eukprot:162929_1
MLYVSYYVCRVRRCDHQVFKICSLYMHTVKRDRMIYHFSLSRIQFPTHPKWINPKVHASFLENASSQRTKQATVSSYVRTYSHARRTDWERGVRSDFTTMVYWTATRRTDSYSVTNALIDTQLQRALNAAQSFEVALQHTSSVEGGGSNSGKASLWHDRGTALWRAVRIVSRRVDGSERESDFRTKSVACFREAVQLDPDSHRHWNGLGVSDSRPPVKQHCFAKSTQLDSRSTLSWDNMSLFYLGFGERDLARQTITKSQILDPTRSSVWFAQGVFNESLRTETAEIQAKSAFRHAAESDAELPSLLGLSHASYSLGEHTSSYIKIRHLLSRDPMNTAAWNLLGLVYERRGEPKEAVNAYRHCLSLLKSVAHQSRLPLDSARSKVSQNLARAFCSLGQADAALEVLESINPDAELTLTSLQWRALAFAHWKSSERGHADKCLDEALTSSTSVAERLRIAVFKCQVMASFGLWDEAAEIVKMWLMENPESASLLIVQCAIAFHRGDLETVQRSIAVMSYIAGAENTFVDHSGFAASPDIKNFSETLRDSEKRKRLSVVVHILNAMVSVMKKEPSQSKRSLQAALHLFPASERLRNLAGRFLLDFCPDQAMCVSSFSTDLESCDGEKESKENVFGDRLEVIANASVITGGSTSSCARMSTVAAAARLVHQQPDSAAHWKLLGRAAAGRAVGRKRSSDFAAALRLVEEFRDLSSNTVVETTLLAELLLLSGDGECSMDIILQANSNESSSPSERALISRHIARVHLSNDDVKSSIEEYRKAIRKDPYNVVLWEELSHIYESIGEVDSSSACLESGLKYLTQKEVSDRDLGQISSTKNGHFRLSLRLARLCYFNKKYVRGVSAASNACDLMNDCEELRKPAIFIKSLFLRKLRRWKPALEALETTSSSIGLASIGLSMIRLREGDVEGAELAARLAEDTGTNDVRLLESTSIRANAAYAQGVASGDRHTAALCFQRALFQSPTRLAYRRALDKCGRGPFFKDVENCEIDGTAY